MQQATGTFESTRWEEQPFQEWDDGGKLTRADVTFTFRGDIEGESTTAYVMAYPTEAEATFVGFDRVVGRVGNRSGSFILQQSGTYQPGELKASWVVVPGSGTGELAGLRGSGGYEVKDSESHVVPFTLDYEFE